MQVFLEEGDFLSAMRLDFLRRYNSVCVVSSLPSALLTTNSRDHYLKQFNPHLNKNEYDKCVGPSHRPDIELSDTGKTACILR